MITTLRVALCALLLSACAADAAAKPSPTVSPDCAAYAPLLPADAEIQHVKTAVTVVEVLSPCTVRVRVASMPAAVQAAARALGDQVIVLRATTQTTYRTAGQGDLAAIGRFGLKPGDVFTLSFDSREFPDGSHPLNFMNR